MTSERWRQLEDLFHSTRDRAPRDRAAFLDAACADDRTLREQVEGLIESFDAAGDFIEKPLIEDSLSNASRPSESIVGHKIDNYEILSLIGAGGMGEVYLARDARLDRQIALKFLPAQFTADPAQVQRFEREARAASALNHPNIITIYEIGQEDGMHFIATEFIEGCTLREVIVNGKMQLRESLEIAAQIASALAAAQAVGIVHRDIKPENVMIRPDGLVKLLDFGLAKPVGRDGEWGVGSGEWGVGIASFPHSPLPTPHSPLPLSQTTDPGMLMGTLAYLSPEQVRGETADHRTDIFSLGVVLYEMIVGERPFKGESNPAILEAILLAEPAPITTRHSDLADGLTQIVVRALDKARDARHRSAGDLRDDLQRLLKKLESASTDVAGDAKAYRPVRTWRRMLVKVAWLIVSTAVPIAVWLGWQISMRKPEAAGATWANAVSRPLTAYKGEEFFPSLSPDARYFVYARRLDNDWDICLQRVGESHFDNLTSDSESDDTQPVYSPDGARLAFRSERNDGGIFLLDADGKNVTQIVNEGFNPAWSPDGKEIFYATASTVFPASRDALHSEIRAVNIATREKRTAFAGDAMQPQVSPRGLRVAYWAAQQGGQRDIWTVPSRGGVPAPVTNDAWTDWNPVWAPDGKYLYFSSDRQGVLSLWRVPIDEESGTPVGPPQAVTGPAVAFWHFSLSQDGKHLAFVQRILRANFNRIGFDPVKGRGVGERVQITQETRPITAPDLSPNGEWLAWYSYGGAQEDIYITKCDGSEQRQLTNDPCKDRIPRWSPDGGRVAFFSDCSGQYEVWTVNVETGERRRITYDNSHAGSVIPIWSPDGSRIVYHLRGLNTFIIDANKPWAEQNRIALAPMKESDQWLLAWSWSRDGEKLAGLRARPDRHLPGIFVYTLKSQQYQQVTKIGRDPVWLSDNRRLLFIHQRHIYLADSQANTFRRLLSFDPYEIGQV